MRPRNSIVPVCSILGIAALLFPSTGCGLGGSSPKYPDLVPVTGTVKVDGQPLAGAVVTFLQTDEFGTTGNGETDEEGTYELQAMNVAGIAAGRYRVGISYLMPPSGNPVGLSARSSLAPVADLAVAEELLPPKYSDLGRTELEVTVPEGGGTFDFDLEGPLFDPPTAEDEDQPQAGDEVVPAGDEAASTEETS